MESKFLSLKSRATSLRKRGLSIRYIENKFKIPRSTLSGWFKDIKLSKEKTQKLFNKWENGLINARKKSALIHKEQRQNRQNIIRKEAEDFLANIDINLKISEIILATFYLAEGSKKETNFSLANSNPKILKGIVDLLRRLYKLDESKLRCALHLRKDQNEEVARTFWSKTLNIPEKQFIKSQFDKRTIKKTYEHYKGVCVVNYYDLALQRRILYIGDKLLEIINKNMGG